MKTAITLFAFILVFSLIPDAFAQNDNAVTSELKLFKISVQNGEEIAEEITEIQPGDTVEYRLTYTNNLTSPISRLKPVLPVPDGVVYIANTAQPNLDAASLRTNGPGFEQLPIMRRDTLPSGETVEKEVPATEYRRLQWIISSLDDGAAATLKVRMRVQSNNSAK